MSVQQSMLLALAKELAARESQRPGVEAILLTGSVAQGYGDDASDIDMMIYYAELPDEETFDALKAEAIASGGNIYGYDPKEGLACYQFVNGVKVDMAHQQTSGLEQLLHEYLEKPDVSSSTQQIIMSGVQSGLPLYGETILQSWQDQLAELPPGYARKLVETHLRFYPISVMAKMGVARGDLAFVYETLIEASRNILYVLCGLNNVIPPGKVKGLNRSLEKMAIAPANIIERMDAIWTLSPVEITAAHYAIIGELIDLVAMYMPEIDTARVRERLQIPVRKAE